MATSKDKKTEIKTDELTFDLLAGYKRGDDYLKEVSIREMNGADEEAIAKAEVRGNVGKLITTLLASCVTKIGDGTAVFDKKSMSPAKWEQVIQNLYLGDRDLILLKLREFTYGDTMQIESQCPDCGKRLTIEFFTSELEITPVTCDPSRISFELPKGYTDKDGTVYRTGFMRIPIGIDQEVIDPLARRNPGVANTTLMARCVTEMEGLKLSPEVFRLMSKRDREYLIQLLSESTFGPKFLLNVTCDSCGSEFETGVNPINFI